MAWLFRGRDLADVTSGGRYSVRDDFATGWFTRSHRDPRALMRVGRPVTTRWPDTRRFTMYMTVWGESPAEFATRLYEIGALLSSPGTLKHTLPNGWVLTMEAYAYRIQPTTHGPNSARLQVEFESLDEPFFRRVDPVQTSEATITTSDPPYVVEFTHHNPGLDDRGARIRFYGPCSNPTLFNVTLGEFDYYCGYQGDVADGAFVELDVRTFTLTDNAGNVLNPISVVHSGDRYWFILRNGDNELKFGADDSGGRVEIVQQPPF